MSAELGGRINHQGHDMRTARTAPQMRHAMPGKFEVTAALRTGWYFHMYLAVDSRHLYLRAECRINHIDMLFAENEITFARELFVRPHADMDV